MSLLGKLWQGVQTVANTVADKKPATSILGLDLGQAQDFTALCGLEQTVRADGPNDYACRYLARFPLGTPYTSIVSEVAKIARQVPPNASLAVDMTGVGRPVVEMLRAQLPIVIWPITITAGLQHAQDEDGWKVPKRELVSVVQLLLQAKRLTIAKQLPDAALLSKELATFQTKITTAGHETFGAWREGAHDDCVLALAIAAWVGENVCIDWSGIRSDAHRHSLLARAPEGVFFEDHGPANDYRYFGGRTPDRGERIIPSW
jgi:hypothetical protein